jgi:hypothetical protein
VDSRECQERFILGIYWDLINISASFQISALFDLNDDFFETEKQCDTTVTHASHENPPSPTTLPQSPCSSERPGFLGIFKWNCDWVSLWLWDTDCAVPRAVRACGSVCLNWDSDRSECQYRPSVLDRLVFHCAQSRKLSGESPQNTPESQKHDPKESAKNNFKISARIQTRKFMLSIRQCISTPKFRRYIIISHSKSRSIVK